MNIIIFDKENNCYQFHAGKRWISNFVNTPKFFTKDSAQLQAYINSQIKEEDKSYGEFLQIANLDSPESLSKLDFNISGDYGIAMIDFEKQVGYLMSEYCSLGVIVDGAIGSAIIGRTEINELEKYKALLEQDIFEPMGGSRLKLLAKIDEFLNASSLKRNILKIKTLETLLSEKRRFGELTLTTNSGWVMECGPEKDDRLPVKIVEHILNKGINFTESQKEAWIESYNEIYEYFLEDHNTEDMISVERFKEMIEIRNQKYILNAELPPSNVSASSISLAQHKI